MKKKEAKKTKLANKQNINLYIPPELLERIAEEAEEFKVKSISKYVAILLSHRKDTVERIRNRDIIIV